MDFKAWKRKVDAIVYHCTGYRTADLPEYRYRDAWHGMMTPARAAYEVIEESGLFR
jgi:hypothetical protein